MNLNVGTIRSNQQGFETIAGFNESTRNLRQDWVKLDFNQCTFFEAHMAAPLYVLIARLRNELNDVGVLNLSNQLVRILKKNNFLNVFNMESSRDTHQTTIPFKIFRLSAAEDQFNDYLDAYMDGKSIPNMSAALTKRFRQSLFEIFSNAAIHSLSKQGIFTCGQYFPKKNRLDFTIADAGVGILEKVQKYKQDKKIDSCEAIRWVLTEGNTTKQGNEPGGLGLKLIQDFIRINHGKLQIVSRFGYYELTSAGDQIVPMKYDFPGTCVNIEINTQDTNNYRLKSELVSTDIF